MYRKNTYQEINEEITNVEWRKYLKALLLENEEQMKTVLI